MDGVLRYPAALLESLLWSRCKLWGWEGIAFWDNAAAFFSCFEVGDLTWLDVAQQLKQIFFGEAYEESFLCVHCFILFACLLLFFLMSYINQHLWELWFPPSPPRTFRRIFTGSDFKGRTWVFLGMSLSGDTLKSQGICVEPGWAWN